VRRALPDRFWPPIRALAMNYIALAFLKDFARHGIHSFANTLSCGTGDWRHVVFYVPFAVLAVVGPLLRLAAWVRKPTHKAVKLSTGASLRPSANLFI
jgi:hypothetical protein